MNITERLNPKAFTVMALSNRAIRGCCRHHLFRRSTCDQRRTTTSAMREHSKRWSVRGKARIIRSGKSKETETLKNGKSIGLLLGTIGSVAAATGSFGGSYTGGKGGPERELVSEGL